MEAAVAVEQATQLQRVRVVLCGVVQGVGFRPFVYRLATELGLTGWVSNDTRGVCIEVEGAAAALGRFLERMQTEHPAQARLHSIETVWSAPLGSVHFEIRHSALAGSKTAAVLPDIATCATCLAEVLHGTDRRAGYPFTNCTTCGPRFTIIQALPYDRPYTTMQRFTMCPACRAEYDDPGNRRFHAQPNACPVCGPRLTLWTSTGTPIAEGSAALSAAAEALSGGQVVAVKGLGGFHLLVDARNTDAVARLRARKSRDTKPFALMAGTLEHVQSLCDVPHGMAACLTAPEAPIVLLRRRPGALVAENVAPNNPFLGVMLPCTPLHHLLMRELPFPVVATSGNRHDEPVCIDEAAARQRLGHIADLFLVHDRPIARHVDDSVGWVVLDELRLLRRARGYAPLPVMLHQTLPGILAVGAHLKNTVAVSVGQQVFLSQHIGDLETLEAFTAFERVIGDVLSLYEARPVAIAHDLHPDYLSTRWAQERAAREGLRLIPVQHHHAHFAACLADNGEPGPALGVTWDGTGYGPDGTIWGGEFLLGTPSAVVRVAHLRPFSLPGGEVAVREPRRVALALLWELYGEQALAWDNVMSVLAFGPAEQRILLQMLQRGVNTLRTTSMGRLFDAVAALIGLHQHVTFEGQAAMALEFAADCDVQDAYPIVLGRDPTPGSMAQAPLMLDWQPLIEAVLADRRRGVASGVMAARFHNALVEALLAVVGAVGETQVALTGGCFQNRWLLERVTRRLRAMGCKVLLHRQVPPNDGGISLGQVVVAAAQWTG